MHFLFARCTADWPHGGATSHLIKGSMKPSHTTASSVRMIVHILLWHFIQWKMLNTDHKYILRNLRSDIKKHKTRCCSSFGPDISSTHRYSTAVIFTCVCAEQQHRKPHIWCNRYTASPLQHPQTPLSSQHPLTSFPWGSLAHLNIIFRIRM